MNTDFVHQPNSKYINQTDDNSVWITQDWTRKRPANDLLISDDQEVDNTEGNFLQGRAVEEAPEVLQCSTDMLTVICLMKRR